MLPSGLALSQNAVQAGLGHILGVVVLGANDAPVGLGTLQWDSGTDTMTWTDSALNTFAIVCNSSGLYAFAYGTSTQVMIYVDYPALPAGIHSTNWQIKQATQNLLRNVTFAERSTTLEIYRCLYIENRAGRTVTGVTVRVDQTPTYGTVQVGSEYATDTQDSDGATTDLATQLVEETDTAGDLPAISWASTWNCGTMLTAKFLSFWIRYTLPSGSSGASLQTEDFTLAVDYRR